MCFSKYVSLFVRTYPDVCRDRRRHLRLRLNLNLNLNLNLVLYPAPNRASFHNLFRRLFLRSNPALLDTL